MNILLIHQNFPGQYKHLSRALAADPKNTVVAMGEDSDRKLDIPGLKYLPYPAPKSAGQETHHYIRGLEGQVRRGQEIARQAFRLKQSGFVPDIVCAHSGWGESLYIRDVFPDTKLLPYFEFYYHYEGADVGFDPEYPPSVDDMFRLRTRNACSLLSLESCDAGISPTKWQKSVYPREFRSKIQVCHEGVDTRVLKPNPKIQITLSNGTTITRDDEIITYVARNLEPCRGIHTFLRALPGILKARPKAQVLIVGGDGVSYGRKLAPGETYKDKYLKEVDIDESRVHFLGQIPYNWFLGVVQISSVHVYLTYPFVLSWSMLEAMSCGALVVGSSTPPVEEVINHGQNGFLVDFFQPDQIVEKVNEVLDHPDRMEHIRKAARQTIVRRYDLKTKALPKQFSIISKLLKGK